MDLSEIEEIKAFIMALDLGIQPLFCGKKKNIHGTKKA